MTYYHSEAARDVYAALDAYPVKGKIVLVIGTMNPWIECILVAYGKAALPVHTVDFNKPVVQSEAMKALFHTMSIPELDAVVNGGLRYDAILSFSSLEHDGKASLYFKLLCSVSH